MTRGSVLICFVLIVWAPWKMPPIFQPIIYSIFGAGNLWMKSWSKLAQSRLVTGRAVSLTIAMVWSFWVLHADYALLQLYPLWHLAQANAALHSRIYDCRSKGPRGDCPLQRLPGFQHETTRKVFLSSLFFFCESFRTDGTSPGRDDLLEEMVKHLL